MAAAVAPSEDPRGPRASPKVLGPETDLESGSGGEPASHQKAIPAAHLTFLIDCAHGKQLSLAAPPVRPRTPRPNLGPVTPPVKTYILFCGENQPHLIQEAPLAEQKSLCLSQGRSIRPTTGRLTQACSTPRVSVFSQSMLSFHRKQDQ
ncbi:Steroid Receptor-Associated And Regulated Protein [Manis pentadactyla]|nr:Steroid Receptor-Associated And Regulated Protein [Manis pentadactyla]